MAAHRDYDLIPLYYHGRPWASAVVDAADYNELSRYRWRYEKGYAVRGGGSGAHKGTRVSMHRQLVGLPARWSPGGPECDHVNGVSLDNRRANLRVLSRGENNRNRRATCRARLTGAYRRRGSLRWFAAVKINYHFKHLGSFATQEEAAAKAAEYRALHAPTSRDAMEDSSKC